MKTTMKHRTSSLGVKTNLILLIFISIQSTFTTPVIANEYLTDSIPKGIVVDSVLCKANPEFSYAVFIPIQYNENKLWPIIYVFDPSANGKIEANLYREAAEKYGYIVVCSNNSKNGPWEDCEIALKYTMEDAEERFSFDKNRVYTSGFSGGSRLASFIALSTQKIAGVIGYCAGFPPKEKYFTSQIKGFDYIGLIGKRDWNYYELVELEKTLQKYKLNAKLITSDLNHELPSKESIMEAVEWMEFNAMKKNLCLKNDSFIRAQFDRYIKNISILEKNGDVLDVATTIKYLINDFSGLMNISFYEAKFDSVINTKTYIRRTKEVEKIHADEQLLVEKYNSLSREITKSGIFTDSIMYWWVGEAERLKKMENNSNKDKQYMASRLLRNIFNIHIEMGNKFYEAKQYPFAILSFKICCTSVPNIKYSYYALACAQALSENSTAACKTLEKLIELGFKNKKIIESEPAFTAIKNNKRFVSIMKSLE